MKEYIHLDEEKSLFYNKSAAVNEIVVAKIIDFCKKYHCWCGESLMQNDNGQIYSPELISDIIDNILQFDLVSTETTTATYVRCPHCDTAVLQGSGIEIKDIDSYFYTWICPACGNACTGRMFKGNVNG